MPKAFGDGITFDSETTKLMGYYKTEEELAEALATLTKQYTIADVVRPAYDQRNHETAEYVGGIVVPVSCYMRPLR